MSKQHSIQESKEEALKYKTKTDFQKKSKGFYLSAYRRGFLDEICSHMNQLKKPHKYWINKERCQQEALKYINKAEFQKNSSSAYNSSKIHGWYDEICSHMVCVGNRKMRLIYSYEFEDNSVYVGLTYNLNKRNNVHLNKNGNSSVREHILFTGLIPFLNKLTDYIDVGEASILEGFYLNEYKNKGWTILNKTKTGTIGGGYKIWTKEKCQEEALKYKTKKEFRKKSCGAYSRAYKDGWLNDICSHMELKTVKPRNYWTKEKCQEEALKYNKKIVFLKMSCSAYVKSQDMKWLNENCSHMKK
jgi:hypothetical protein